MESQSFNPDNRRAITDDNARIPLYVSIVFQSHVLSSLLSHSFDCPLYSRVQFAREFCDVSIPSDFRDFIQFHYGLLIHHMVFIGTDQQSSIASHLKGLDYSFKF